MGRLIDARDAQGRQYREVPEGGAPEVGIVVRPDASGTGDGWNLRLTLHYFAFSPDRSAGPQARLAVAGRGTAGLSLDGKPLAVLRGPGYHLPARLVSRGTHELTARLYADDGTVWAVRGKPIETTAELTASDAGVGQKTDAPDAEPSPGDTGSTP